MPSAVSQIPAATSEHAAAHFATSFAFETDCADVQQALTQGADFVLLDVRGPNSFASAHVPAAENVPYAQISAARMEHYPARTLFVVYCAGPHCNGAQRAALRLAKLGRPVKVMIGGMSGWQEENFPLARGSG
jgi:rhodanese-related sulfurtransferase